jgi:purine catabolism regulator
VATVAALEVANRFREREVLRRERAETLAELLAGVLDAETASKRLVLAGFEADPRVVLLAMSAPDAFDAARLVEVWTEVGVPHLLLMQRELYALVADRPGWPDALERVPDLRAGASRVFPVAGGIAAARHEARWALQRATESGQTLVRFPDEEANASWLPADAATLRQLVERVLGPVLAYDADRGTDLVRSVRVWLERDRRTESAAKALHVHKHTLAYRLRRVEELSGRDLSSMQDAVDVWLALRAHHVLAGAEG